jgi:hypothetical protein
MGSPAMRFSRRTAPLRPHAGAEYSEGEKFLLTRTNALTVDPNIRRRVTTDVGQEDLGPDFATRLLNQPAGTTPAAQAQAGATTATPAATPAP